MEVSKLKPFDDNKSKFTLKDNLKLEQRIQEVASILGRLRLAPEEATVN